MFDEGTVVLKDGSMAQVRPVTSADRAALESFLRSLSKDAVLSRFNSLAISLGSEAERWADVGTHAYGLVALGGTERGIVAHAEYIRTDPKRAEVAFATADLHRGLGLATLLLAELARHARANGIQTFEAFVLPENRQMANVLRESGFSAKSARGDEYERWELATDLTSATQDRYDRREAVALRTSLQRLLSPRGVAVIGASRTRGTIGAEIFHNLITTTFNGAVYPVNRTADVVQSVRAYPSVADVPGPVDVAVIVVPAAHVIGVARECAGIGVAALIVISAGFAEAGPVGILRQRELLAICRESGMRLVGPNCMGVLNTDPTVRLNATFAPLYPPVGRVGFLSQSGALGLSVIEHAVKRGIGLSTFVSVGNKADVSGNDLLAFWEGDPRTDVLLLYLESFGNPRKFARIARRIGRIKPIVAVKSGRSVAGARATSSHTGALVASSDVTTDALFRQTGVIRTGTLAELFDVAALLANQPLPSGSRVGILTNAGGPAILAADACEAAGLEVPPLADEMRAKLRAILAAESATGNPVDMIASAGADEYAKCIAVLAADPGLDAIVVMFTPPLVTKATDVARAIRSAVDALPRAVPVLAVFLSLEGVPPELSDERVRIPSFAYPEDAARALAHVVRYARWRARPAGTIPRFDAREEDADALLDRCAATGGGWLAPSDVATLLECYGLPLISSRSVGTPEEAAAAARDLAGPVALKVIAPSMVHKTEVGAVRLGLHESEVAAEARRLAEAVRAKGHVPVGFLVQPMAPNGVELLLGVVQDPTFGPVVACGAGGVTAEVLKDVAVGVAPLTDIDARDMVRSLRTFALLDGFRGAPKCDIPAVEDALLRLAAMVERHPQIAELDANPLIAHARGAVIVDARVRVDALHGDRPLQDTKIIDRRAATADTYVDAGGRSAPAT
ncbi:MAG TPA: GNAT family N-acetyltransferase [Candidatus Limnocylindria bacterium]|nr:GNAT family N-acetyltransferase [Candidatus Limnocylindria bacterium]